MLNQWYFCSQYLLETIASLSLFPLFLLSLLDRLSLFLSRAIIVAICQSNQPLHAPRSPARTDRGPSTQTANYLPYTHTDLRLCPMPGKVPGGTKCIIESEVMAAQYLSGTSLHSVQVGIIGLISPTQTFPELFPATDEGSN